MSHEPRVRPPSARSSHPAVRFEAGPSTPPVLAKQKAQAKGVVKRSSLAAVPQRSNLSLVDQLQSSLSAVEQQHDVRGNHQLVPHSALSPLPPQRGGIKRSLPSGKGSGGAQVVQQLLQRRRAPRASSSTWQFLVRWEGYDEEHDSWEDEANIFDTLLIDKFVKHGGSAGRSTGGSSAKRSSSIGSLPPLYTPAAEGAAQGAEETAEATAEETAEATAEEMAEETAAQEEAAPRGFRRPPGRTPRGKQWCTQTGVWVAADPVEAPAEEAVAENANLAGDGARVRRRVHTTQQPSATDSSAQLDGLFEWAIGDSPAAAARPNQRPKRHSDAVRLLPRTPHYSAIAHAASGVRGSASVDGGDGDGDDLSPLKRIQAACQEAIATLFSSGTGMTPHRDEASHRME